jgi:uncharacterized RDD family membrane protein YckC
MAEPPSRLDDRDLIRLAPDERTRGVLGVRLVAFIIDVVVIGLIALVVSMSVAFLGLVTFGIGWMLFPAVGVCTAMAYAAATIGGRGQATIGMKASGLKVERLDGGPPDPITAAAHALLFYVATATFALWGLAVLIGLLRQDGRMGHDLLTGFVVVRDLSAR